MRKLPDIIKYIQIDSTGEITGQQYVGGFRLKLIITHDDRFAIERLYKQMLPNDDGIVQDITLKAGGIAELERRIVEAPKWWSDARNGRDLVDGQPIYDLLIAVNAAFEQWKLDLKKQVNADPSVPSVPTT